MNGFKNKIKRIKDRLITVYIVSAGVVLSLCYVIISFSKLREEFDGHWGSFWFLWGLLFFVFMMIKIFASKEREVLNGRVL